MLQNCGFLIESSEKDHIDGLGFGFLNAEVDGFPELKYCHGRMSCYLKWHKYRNSFI